MLIAVSSHREPEPLDLAAFERLLHDPDRLAQLLDAHQVTGVGIPFLAHGHVEIVLLVAGIGKRFANVLTASESPMG